ARLRLQYDADKTFSVMAIVRAVTRLLKPQAELAVDAPGRRENLARRVPIRPWILMERLWRPRDRPVGPQKTPRAEDKGHAPPPSPRFPPDPKPTHPGAAPTGVRPGPGDGAGAGAGRLTTQPRWTSRHETPRAVARTEGTIREDIAMLCFTQKSG